MTDWIAEGKPAPDFTLPADEGGDITLSKLRGAPVVVYFYPRDNTPGCTREACAFRDLKSELKKLGATVLGISGDSLKSHARFRGDHRLNFPLLADADRAVAKKFGAWREKLMYGKKVLGIQRSTFLIDAQGIVRKVWPNVKVDGHDAQVLEALRALQSGAPSASAKQSPAKKTAAKKATAKKAPVKQAARKK